MKEYLPRSKIYGTIQAPPSKSMMLRAIAAAALSKGQTTIRNPAFCDDAQVTLRVVNLLGASVLGGGHNIVINSGQMPRGNLLDCGESGLCMRMFCAIASLFSKEMKLEGKDSLTRRPLPDIQTPLSKLGVEVQTNDGYPPVIVKGPMTGGEVRLDGSQSSQFITGMLFALPLCKEKSSLEITNLNSVPYIRMTLSVLRKFGIAIEHNDELDCFQIPAKQTYMPCNFRVEGDWSGAAFMMVAGAVAGKVNMTGLDPNSLQADKGICRALKDAGAKITVNPGVVKVQKDRLQSFSFDARDCPDLFPPLVALAANCEGTSIIRGTGRLFFKESNRANELCEKFGKLGIRVEVCDDEMLVQGGRIRNGEVHSGNDHRIAMALATAALTSEKGVWIDMAECVSKSYPTFYDDLRKIME